MNPIRTRLAAALVAAPALAAGSIAAAAPASAAAALTVRFVQVTRAVTASGATMEAPKVTVTGGRAGVAQAITVAVRRHQDALAARFAAQAADAIANGGSPPSMVFDGVTGRMARSAHYLTIRLDESVNLGGAHPSNSVHAYVFDAATGREVTAGSLFSAPRRVDRLIRTALIAQNRQVTLTAADVAGLSIVPDRSGSTAPLSCWPIRAGLHCAVDQGGVLGYAAGEFDATVSWRALAPR